MTELLPVLDERYSAAIYNFTPANTRKLRKSLGNVIAGSSRARWAVAGSSSVVGVGTTPPNYKAHSFVAYLAEALAKLGIPAQWNSLWGTSGYLDNAGHNQADARTTFTADWTNLAGASLGGNLFTNPAGTGALTTSFVDAYDSIDIWYNRLSGGGIFDALIDTVSQGTTNTNGGAAVLKKSVTGLSLATHLLEIKRASGGAVNIVGAEAFNSAAPAINLLNMGWSGSDSSDWASTTASRSPRNALPVIAPDATFLLIGNNDLVAGRSPSDFVANMTSVIQGAKLSGDAVLIAPQFINPATLITSGPSTGQAVGQPAQDAYAAALKQLALDADCPLLNWQARIGSYAQGVADGAYADDLHVARFVHAPFGRFVAELVAVFREVRRVLREDGTLWLNLGLIDALGVEGGVAAVVARGQFCEVGHALEAGLRGAWYAAVRVGGVGASVAGLFYLGAHRMLGVVVEVGELRNSEVSNLGACAGLADMGRSGGDVCSLHRQEE